MTKKQPLRKKVPSKAKKPTPTKSYRTRYVDGFVVPVPKKNVPAYTKMAKQGAKIWMKHGALAYKECVLEDDKNEFFSALSQMNRTQKMRDCFFSYIEYKSRAHRDSVNKKVMQDPDLCAGMDPSKMPFDCKNMIYSGFEVVVDERR